MMYGQEYHRGINNTGASMSNPYMIHRRAFDAAEGQAMFHRLESSQWTWAGELFLELGRPSAAERCFKFAQEHVMTAKRLTGEVAIGAAEDVRGAA